MIPILIVFGCIFVGTIDRIRGDSRVVTRFFHLFFLPLIPLGSYITTERRAKEGFRGISIGLCFRSVLVAYLRTWGILLGIPLTAGGVMFCMPHITPGMDIFWLFAAMGPLLIAGGIWSWFLWRDSTPRRFEEVCERIGVDPSSEELDLRRAPTASGRPTPVPPPIPPGT